MSKHDKENNQAYAKPLSSISGDILDGLRFSALLLGTIIFSIIGMSCFLLSGLDAMVFAAGFPALLGCLGNLILILLLYRKNHNHLLLFLWSWMLGSALPTGLFVLLLTGYASSQ